MKNSIERSRNLSANDESCSEQKCATCFENRGCMYEQYVSALMGKIEEAYLASHIHSALQQIGKRA